MVSDVCHFQMAFLSARVRVALCPLRYGTVLTHLSPPPASPPFIVNSLQLLPSTQQILAFGVAIAWPRLACPLIQPSLSHGPMVWVAKVALVTIMSMTCTLICTHATIIPTLMHIPCSITATAVLWTTASVPFCCLAWEHRVALLLLIQRESRQSWSLLPLAGQHPSMAL